MNTWKQLKEELKKNENFNTEYEIVEMKTKLIKELYSYRKEYNLSQTEFAEKIGVKQQVISRFEKGEIDPRFSFIARVIKGMSKTINLQDIYINTTKLIKFSPKKNIKNQNISLNAKSYSLNEKYLAR